jgi:hypothetical protein
MGGLGVCGDPLRLMRKDNLTRREFITSTTLALISANASVGVLASAPIKVSLLELIPLEL